MRPTRRKPKHAAPAAHTCPTAAPGRTQATPASSSASTASHTKPLSSDPDTPTALATFAPGDCVRFGTCPQREGVVVRERRPGVWSVLVSSPPLLRGLRIAVPAYHLTTTPPPKPR